MGKTIEQLMSDIAELRALRESQDNDSRKPLIAAFLSTDPTPEQIRAYEIFLGHKIKEGRV